MFFIKGIYFQNNAVTGQAISNHSHAVVDIYCLFKAILLINLKKKGMYVKRLFRLKRELQFVVITLSLLSLQSIFIVKDHLYY